MEKSSSEDSSIHRSPSVDSRDSAKPSTSSRDCGRGFTAGAFFGTSGSRTQSQAGVKRDKYSAPKGGKYVVFYLDLSFVFLLEFKKCNMARGCLCCLKYMMFLFNLIFWVSGTFFLYKVVFAIALIVISLGFSMNPFIGVLHHLQQL